MFDKLYTLNSKSAVAFFVLTVGSLLICHYGIVDWDIEYWHTQRLAVALVGVIANVGIIYYHVTTPPHPKFLMSPKRKVTIRLHAIFGISEIMAGIGSYLFPDTGLGYIFAVLAVLHALTSFVQSPAVFGAKAVMVPSYFFASTLHLYCGVRLFADPYSEFWMMNTFLTLNIYAYVRIFMIVFEQTGIFKDNHYSASVLFAGVPILPALMGPISMFFIAVYIWVFAQFCKFWFGFSDAEYKEYWTEHVRVGLINEKQKNQWLLKNLGEIPTGNLRVDREFATKIFNQLDTDKSGILDQHELVVFFESWGLSSEAVASIMYHVDGEVTFDRFFSLLRSANLLSEDLKILKKESCENDEDRAKVIFQELDFDNSGYIEKVELEMLLLEYGLPRAEVETYLAKHDPDNDGKISFSEFKTNFEPLWKFAYYTVE